MPRRRDQVGSLLVPGHPRPEDYVMPPRVAAEVQRILDREARRLLAEELDMHAARSSAGGDGDSLDQRLDQISSSRDRQVGPVGRRIDSTRRNRGRAQTRETVLGGSDALPQLE